MSERKDTRVERIPLHQQNILKAHTRDGFVRSWVFERMVDRYKLAGWSIVEDPEMKTHDGQIQISEKFGSAVTRVLNLDPFAVDRTAILMEIPENIYKEDYMHEQRQIALQEQLIDRAGELANRNFYGKVEISRE